MTTTPDQVGTRAIDIRLLVSAVVAAALLLYVFWDGLARMVGKWDTEEYSHGYLIPVIALLMVWQNWENIATRKSISTWVGIGILVPGILIFLMGELSTLYVVIQYAFLITMAGVVLAYFGLGAVRFLWVPLLYLAFMIPLPEFLYSGLSTKLQLISSELGTAIIRLVGISVFLSGNVIDLGAYKLQVVEACSGLRYLFPLMSFGFLISYLYKGPIWHKLVLFASTIPITIMMNSVRIGVIGVLVEYWGIGLAEGFLHDFEGWVVFLACVTILFLEVWMLFDLTGGRGPLASYFRFDVPKWHPLKLAPKGQRSVPRAYISALALLLVAAVGTTFLEKRQELALDRKAFVSFPNQLADWQGKKEGMAQQFLKVLQLDDYILSNYRRLADRNWVNFYVAYYKSQKKGQSAHSPSSCIPGDGWKISEFREHSVGVGKVGQSLTVNRAIISKGSSTQLVYYWFPQRGRQLTNEYLVKWYLFWDALTRNRTDGALVRLVTSVRNGDFKQADARLKDFLNTMYPHLNKFVPD